MTTRLSVLALALLCPALALAQAPAGPDPKAPEPKAADTPAAPAPPPTTVPAPAAAPDPKDAPAATPTDPAKEAPKEATKEAPKAAPPTPTGPHAPLAWLNGCWAGNVNQRDFREYWHPLRGGMLVGVGHNALRDRTVSYELLRLEAKPDGVYYIAAPKDQKEVTFKLTDTRKDGPDEIFTFTNGANPFPQIISYRRATGGWLYVEVAGKQAGKDQKVIYPFRRVDCESSEFIRK